VKEQRQSLHKLQLLRKSNKKARSLGAARLWSRMAAISWVVFDVFVLHHDTVETANLGVIFRLAADGRVDV